MRDKVLERWVAQPPAAPIIQYLRDAERVTALDQLEERTHVLDIASESNVTAGLDADTITRIDFSEDAISHAQDILGDTVDRYAVVDPEHPTLPLEDDTVDGAVCIGPYDWKFLDIDVLTDEVHRVLEPGGLFSFSVPTRQSPYAVRGRNRFRYYTPREARTLLATEWRLTDYDLVFQYPHPAHGLIKALPYSVQEYFVDAAWTLTDLLTDRDDWDHASYLVLGATPLDYETALTDTLACLFRPTAENGFWDEHDEKIIRALEYQIEDPGGVGDPPTLSWSRDDTIEWRYAPFALMGAMEWRASQLGDDTYDEKLERALAYFLDRVADEAGTLALPSYGIGPLTHAFTHAAKVYDDDRYESAARSLFAHAVDRFDFTHAEDSLLLVGWSTLYEHTGDDAVYAAIDDALWTVNERLDPSQGTFRFENPTTTRHQNQMYTLWGLARAIDVTGKPGYLDSVEIVLDHTVDHRMRDDGAFIWEDVPRRHKAYHAVRDHIGGGIRPPHWDFLYACHQTFFVNAVAYYYAAGGDRDYDLEVARAMGWLYGDNALGLDLSDVSGLGVPQRFLTTDGRMDVPDQMYKGSYELGSALMALTFLLDGPLGTPQSDRPQPTPEVAPQ